MNTFTLGERVVLKTKPYMPVMTVLKINENGTYYCEYEDEHHMKVEHGTYDEGLLKKYFDPATIILF